MAEIEALQQNQTALKQEMAQMKQQLDERLARDPISQEEAKVICQINSKRVMLCCRLCIGNLGKRRLNLMPCENSRVLLTNGGRSKPITFNSH